MKLTKEQLRKIIKEELSSVAEDNSIDQGEDAPLLNFDAAGWIKTNHETLKPLRDPHFAPAAEKVVQSIDMMIGKLSAAASELTHDGEPPMPPGENAWSSVDTAEAAVAEKYQKYRNDIDLLSDYKEELEESMGHSQQSMSESEQTMKLTKEQLKRIIKEELKTVLESSLYGPGGMVPEDPETKAMRLADELEDDQFKVAWDKFRQLYAGNCEALTDALERLDRKFDECEHAHGNAAQCYDYIRSRIKKTTGLSYGGWLAMKKWMNNGMCGTKKAEPSAQQPKSAPEFDEQAEWEKYGN